MDLEQLLAPISEDAPSGPDLSYEASRQEIESFFDANADSEDGEQVDWRDAVRKIVAQNDETKDVWLAVYLTRAGAKLGELETIVTGAQFLAGLFDRYWDTLHPSLDEYGFQGRKGPCESLTRIGEFLGPLRRTAIIEHPRLGRFTGEDLERFARDGDSAEGFGMFRAAIEDVAKEEVQAKVDQLDQLREAVRRVDTILMEHADGDSGTNFQTTYETVESLRRALAPYAGITVPEASEGPDRANASSSTDQATGPRVAGRVDTRDDVIAALDAISEYYARREPASPVPVAVRRVRSWVTMDFMAILADIAPNSVSEAGQVLLSRPSEEDSGSGY